MAKTGLTYCRLASYDDVRIGIEKKILHEAITENRDVESIDKRDEERFGVLHRTKFLRVILDEAHNIKNHKSQCKPRATELRIFTNEPIAAVACYSLDSKYRWAMTGTPIVNELAGKYSDLVFSVSC